MLRAFAMLSLILLCGCREALFHDQSEADAFDMVRVLRAHGVDALKVMQGNEAGRYVVSVPHSEFLAAANVLHLYGLPRAHSASSEANSTAGILPNQRLDDEIALRAHADEVERALLSLEGVVASHVTLSASGEDTALPGEAPPPRASLVLRCRANETGRCSLSEQDARGVLMSALPGLTADNTTVVLQVAEPLPAAAVPEVVSVLGIPVAASAASSLRALLAGLGVLVLVLTALSGALALRSRVFDSRGKAR